MAPGTRSAPVRPRPHSAPPEPERCRSPPCASIGAADWSRAGWSAQERTQASARAAATTGPGRPPRPPALTTTATSATTSIPRERSSGSGRCRSPGTPRDRARRAGPPRRTAAALAGGAGARGRSRREEAHVGRRGCPHGPRRTGRRRAGRRRRSARRRSLRRARLTRLPLCPTRVPSPRTPRPWWRRRPRRWRSLLVADDEGRQKLDDVHARPPLGEDAVVAHQGHHDELREEPLLSGCGGRPRRPSASRERGERNSMRSSVPCRGRRDHAWRSLSPASPASSRSPLRRTARPAARRPSTREVARARPLRARSPRRCWL